MPKALDSITVSLDTARKLAEAGFPQDTVCCFAPEVHVTPSGERTWHLFPASPASYSNAVSAPTLGEILGELPGFYLVGETIYRLTISRFTDEEEQGRLDRALKGPLARLGYPVDHSPDPPRSPVEEFEGDHWGLGTRVWHFAYQRPTDNGCVHSGYGPVDVEAAASLWLSLVSSGHLTPAREGSR